MYILIEQEIVEYFSYVYLLEAHKKRGNDSGNSFYGYDYCII